MTLLEKQGPSTAYGDDEVEQPRNEKHILYQGDPGVPPSYQDTMGASTSAAASSSTFPLPAPTNFTSIRERHNKIAGAWTIDTSLQIPEGLLRPLDQNQTERDNLSLDCTHGSIHAEVALVAGTPQRANIQLSARHGKLHFRMISRVNSQPFRLKVDIGHGEATLLIPPDFQGPLRLKRRHGKVTFSNSLQSRTMSFTEESAFVGDFRSTKFVDFDSWKGDEIEVESQHAKIKIMYSTDMPPRTREQAPPVPPKQEGERLRKRGPFWARRDRDRA